MVELFLDLRELGTLHLANSDGKRCVLGHIAWELLEIPHNMLLNYTSIGALEKEHRKKIIDLFPGLYAPVADLEGEERARASLIAILSDELYDYLHDHADMISANIIALQLISTLKDIDIELTIASRISIHQKEHDDDTTISEAEQLASV
tara:strand:+ start:2165 stop:2614 length:450 start_codon:yes stop_codon:yes gene_type:complete